MSGQTMAATIRPRIDVQTMLDVILESPSGKYLIEVHQGRVVKVSKVEKPKVLRHDSSSPPLHIHVLREKE